MNGKICGVWFGGSGYATSDENDVEEFTSLTDAKGALACRRRCGDTMRQRFAFIARDPEEVFTPGVDETSEIWIYFGTPLDVLTYIKVAGELPYPDRRLFFGPRGGIRIEHC